MWYISANTGLIFRFVIQGGHMVTFNTRSLFTPGSKRAKYWPLKVYVDSFIDLNLQQSLPGHQVFCWIVMHKGLLLYSTNDFWHSSLVRNEKWLCVGMHRQNKPSAQLPQPTRSQTGKLEEFWDWTPISPGELIRQSPYCPGQGHSQQEVLSAHCSC